MSFKRGLCILACLAILVSFPWLGDKPFYTRGEPREALVAYAMFSSGDYVLPEAYGAAIPSKPPFVHWLITAFSKITGQVGEFTSRLPSAIASFLFLIGFYGFLSKRTSPEKALLSCLLLLGSIEWFRCMSVSRVDMVLTCLLSGALLALYRWHERRLSGVPLVPILLLTAATLTKGPVGVVLPCAIFAIFLFAQGHRIPRIFAALSAVTIPAVAFASLWYWQAFAHGGETFSAKVYYENIARFTSTMEDDPHAHSVLYLVGTLFLGLLPWTLLLLPSWISGFRIDSLSWGALRKRVQSLDSLQQFGLISVAVILVFYSIPTSKRSVYLLPAYPFFCAGLAGWLCDFSERQLLLLRRMLYVFASFVLGFAFLAFIVAELPPGGRALSRSADLSFVANVLGSFSISGLGLRISFLLLPLIIAALILKWSKSKPQDVGIGAAVGLVFAVYLAFDVAIMPMFARALSPKPFAQELNSQLDAKDRLYSFGAEFYGLSFYLRRQIFQVGETMPQDGLILLYENSMSELEQFAGMSTHFEIVARSLASVVKPGAHVLLVRPVFSKS